MNSKLVKFGVMTAIVLMLAVSVAVVVLLLKVDSRLRDEFDVAYLCGFNDPVECLNYKMTNVAAGLEEVRAYIQELARAKGDEPKKYTSHGREVPPAAEEK